MRRKQQGVGFIEILVSVVIMSVGILGIAGMQVLSLQQNRSALLRAEALMLANDMLDRVRANPLKNYAGVEFDDPPPDSPDCTAAGANCNLTEMMDFDVAQWKCSINSNDAAGVVYNECNDLGISGSLLNGAGAIIDSTDPALCPVNVGELCVIVQWQDDNNGTISTVTLRTRPSIKGIEYE